MEQHGTVLWNFLGINYGTEHSLVLLICFLEHSAMYGESVVILS